MIGDSINFIIDLLKNTSNYLGGASFIVLIFELIWNHKSKNRLQKNQSQIQNELEILKTRLDTKKYISNMQYQKEFDIYLELFDKVTNLVIYTNSLMPLVDSKPSVQEEADKMYQERYERFNNSLNEIKFIRSRYSPFYMKIVNQKILQMIGLCENQGYDFREVFLGEDQQFKQDLRREMYIDNPKKIKQLQEEVEEEVREYLKGLLIS